MVWTFVPSSSWARVPVLYPRFVVGVVKVDPFVDLGNAPATEGVELLIGKERIDDVLNAIEAAWEQDPALARLW